MYTSAGASTFVDRLGGCRGQCSPRPHSWTIRRQPAVVDHLRAAWVPYWERVGRVVKPETTDMARLFVEEAKWVAQEDGQESRVMTFTESRSLLDKIEDTEVVPFRRVLPLRRGDLTAGHVEGIVPQCRVAQSVDVLAELAGRK